jgi:hypothetical protein
LVISRFWSVLLLPDTVTSGDHAGEVRRLVPSRTAVSPGYPLTVTFDFDIVTNSAYVPPRIYKVSPAASLFIPFWIVRNGCAKVPGFESLPEVDT